MSALHALREASTVEDFICAVADLGDPETGALDDWAPVDMADHMLAIIQTARRYHEPIR